MTTIKRNHIFHPSQRIRLLRYISQGSVVLLLIYLGLRHQNSGGGPQGAAPIDSFCALGGLETIWAYLTTGSFLPKTNVSNFILLSSVVLLTVLTGASFCGWLCPLGTVQDALARVGKGIFGRTFLLPAKWDRYLRPLRFVSLALVLSMTVLTGTLWFADYDPFKALFHFSFETTTAIVLVVVFIIVSILSERFWCRYLCPLGGFFSLLSRFSLVKLKRNQATCLNCSRCTRACPMGLDVSKADTLRTGQCIKCLDCIVTCPVKETLTIQSKL